MYTYGRRVALVKLGFMGAPLSALAKQHLMSAGAGAAGGALLGGEGNRMSGAMGGAALGLAGSHAAGPQGLLGRANRAAGEYPPGGMKPIRQATPNAAETGARRPAPEAQAPTGRAVRSSGEHAPVDRIPTMAPIKRTTYNTAEAGETAPFGHGANSLPPGAGSMMPPSAGPLSTQMTLPPSAGSGMPPSAMSAAPARPDADPLASMLPPSLPPPSIPKPGLMPTLDRRMAAPNSQSAWHSVPPSRYRDTLQSPPPMHR